MIHTEEWAKDREGELDGWRVVKKNVGFEPEGADLFAVTVFLDRYIFALSGASSSPESHSPGELQP
jgi:hypothetical protein